MDIKISPNEEKAITLVVLIISIIILIILAAISIKAIFDIKFLDVALEGAENYTLGIQKEILEFDELAEMLENFNVNIDTPGEVMDPTDVYVTFKGNTLSFWNNEETAKQNGWDINYGNIKDMDEFFVNWNGTINNIPWKDNNNIEKVIIQEKIAPNSTAYFFCGLNKITEIENLDNLITSNADDMTKMFFNASSLTELDLTNFNTNNVTSMDSMFANCSSLSNINVEYLDMGKVENINCMFQGTNVSSLNLCNWDTENIKQTKYTFQNCKALKKLDIKDCNLENVEDMSYFLSNCSNLEKIDMPQGKISKIKDMQYMFIGCNSLTSLNLSCFDTKNVTNMSSMFENCISLMKIIVDRNWVEPSNKTNMFFNCKTDHVTIQ